MRKFAIFHLFSVMHLLLTEMFLNFSFIVSIK